MQNELKRIENRKLITDNELQALQEDPVQKIMDSLIDMEISFKSKSKRINQTISELQI